MSLVELGDSLTMSSPPNSSCQDAQIRSRLLNRLGIYDAPSTLHQAQPMTAAQHRRLRILRGMGVGYNMSFSPPDGSATRPLLDGVKPFQEPLKTDSSIVRTKIKKETRIAFQDEVEVIPIPTRHEYSDRIKSRIWSNRHELQENAERNALEFASEGWNWRSVTEDDGMYICSQSGELVHPIHLQHLVSQNQPPEPEPTSNFPDQPSLERGSPVHIH